ncbi:MarR family winged helix-turn-helix transcriptional regulator [Streptomyces lydicus]|uniref:MarR family winged helix-turn-helix transcriptional regulator n=1 Tax=Streptomyces lydicus TaxID=47763 RepID=UPI001011F53A|nr:MarR family transcriptional regulator [Streptomyces lydicus]MCZ1005950.1 MarR family transcriptional regulator [Streptomyces lydicus]
MTQPAPETRGGPPVPGQEATVPVPAAAGDGPISHTIFRLARLHRMLAGQFLRRSGLHPGQGLIMMHLWELGAQRQTDLVRLMDSDAATMTRTIRRLEQAGFVRRRPSPTDRRASLIEPTAAGHALRHDVEQSWSRLEDLVAAGLSIDEHTAALHTLERLERTLAEAAADPTCRHKARGRPAGGTGPADGRA